MDINTNSVKYTVLRLWIELLKTPITKTKPIKKTCNIDINIKCKLLIKPFAIDSDIKTILKKTKNGISKPINNRRWLPMKTKRKRNLESLIDKSNDFKIGVNKPFMKNNWGQRPDRGRKTVVNPPTLTAFGQKNEVNLKRKTWKWPLPTSLNWN